MKSLALIISLFILTHSSKATPPPTPPLTAKQLITIFTKTPTKDFKAALLKQGFTFDKQTPVHSNQNGGKENIKDAYRLYYKQSTATLMLQVLKDDKVSMMYHLDTKAQFKSLLAQVKKMKLEVKRETPVDNLYQIKHNYGIWFTHAINTIELRNVIFYMDMEAL